MSLSPVLNPLLQKDTSLSLFFSEREEDEKQDESKSDA